MRKIGLLMMVALAFVACRNYTPKPVGYFRIDVPENTYRTFEDKGYPYIFDLSEQAQVVDRSKGDSNQYWIDVYYPAFDGTIYCSYKKIDNNFQKIAEDTREFVYKHTIKADEIYEQPFINEGKRVYGMLYRLEGNTASPTQFVLTDSVTYLFRGALYFNAHPNQDSIAPVLRFVNDDIVRLMETFEHQ